MSEWAVRRVGGRRAGPARSTVCPLNSDTRGSGRALGTCSTCRRSPRVFHHLRRGGRAGASELYLAWLCTSTAHDVWETQCPIVKAVHKGAHHLFTGGLCFVSACRCLAGDPQARPSASAVADTLQTLLVDALTAVEPDQPEPGPQGEEDKEKEGEEREGGHA
jgi:hypothetical protein